MQNYTTTAVSTTGYPYDSHNIYIVGNSSITVIPVDGYVKTNYAGIHCTDRLNKKRELHEDDFKDIEDIL